MVGLKEPDIKTNFMRLGTETFALIQVKWRVIIAITTQIWMHVKLSTSRKLSMALLTLLAPVWQTLQLYVDPRLTTVQKMSTQKLGEQKIGQIWFLNFCQVVWNLNPSGWCLPSLLVIQSIRRVSRHGRLGKLESRVNLAAQQSKFRLSRVNSGPKKKLQQSRLSAYPGLLLLLYFCRGQLRLPTSSDSAKPNTHYILTHKHTYV